MRVALFITCIGDALFPEAGRATVDVLERLGHTVSFPAEQTCCGQMHANSGYSSDASALARRFERVFDGHDTIVAPSASCVGHVRAACPELAARVFELSEFLVDELGTVDVGARFPHRVVYHPTCHSLRITKVGDAPLELLRHVAELELVHQERADECCGFGGTFAIKNAATSTAMMDDKCGELERTGAEVCVALDGSCLLQIGGGLSRRGSKLRTMHLAEVLAAT